MENCIGGAAQGDDHSDGIFECLLGHDIARLDVVLQEIQNRGAGLLRILFLSRTHRRLGATARQTHTHRFDGAGHRVGSIHTSTGPRAGNGATLNLLKARVGELVIGGRANGCETEWEWWAAVSKSRP